MWAGRHVVLGVSGGIACYKSCILARRLTEAGARVDVVLTQGGRGVRAAADVRGLTGRPVLTSLWEPGGALAHVRLGPAGRPHDRGAATAHLIARMAQGLADDLLTTLLLARTAPVLLAPAMNDEMYAHPADPGQPRRCSRGAGWPSSAPRSGRWRKGRPSARAG